MSAASGISSPYEKVYKALQGYNKKGSYKLRLSAV